MAWVRLDDHFDEHPKLAKVGALGWGVWAASLAYCNRNLTDGFIPWNKAHMLASFDVIDGDGKVWSLVRDGDDTEFLIDAEWVISILVDAGLWDVEKGGYRIHDYTAYQPTKQQVLDERAKKVAAGQAGGKASAQARAQAPAQAEPQAQSKQNPTPKPNPNPVPSEDSEESSSDEAGDPPDEKQAPEPKAKTPRKQPEMFVPETFPLEAKHLEYAGKKGLTKTEAERETEKFLLWHGSKQTRYSDWYKAWQGWILKASENKAKLTPFQKPDEEIPGHESWRNRKAVIA